MSESFDLVLVEPEVRNYLERYPRDVITPMYLSTMLSVWRRSNTPIHLPIPTCVYHVHCAQLILRTTTYLFTQATGRADFMSTLNSGQKWNDA